MRTQTVINNLVSLRGLLINGVRLSISKMLILLWFERDLDAPVIRDFVAVLRAHDNGPDFHVPDEHLVEVATKAMSFSSLFYCSCKVQRL